MGKSSTFKYPLQEIKNVGTDHKTHIAITILALRSQNAAISLIYRTQIISLHPESTCKFSVLEKNTEKEMPINL